MPKVDQTRSILFLVNVFPLKWSCLGGVFMILVSLLTLMSTFLALGFQMQSASADHSSLTKQRNADALFFLKSHLWLCTVL